MMESLRPDRDELDQFKNRQTKKKGVNKTNHVERAPNKVTSGGAGVDSSRASVRIDAAPAQNNSIFSLLLMLVLIVAISGGGWLYWQQQLELVELRQNLESATGFIGQSKLLMARMAGELNETGAELEQSGSVAEKKLAFLDSEMRKLWGISNDRNKKAIQGNASGLKLVKTALTKQSKQLDVDTADNKKQFSGLGAQIKKVELGAAKQISSLANEVSITRAELDERLSMIDGAIEQTVVDAKVSSKKNFAEITKLSTLAKKTEKSISSIDATILSIDTSRRQLNERVIDLERKLNKLQLSIKSDSKAIDVQ